MKRKVSDVNCHYEEKNFMTFKKIQNNKIGNYCDFIVDISRTV